MRKEYTIALVFLVFIVGFFSFAKSHLLISQSGVQVYQPQILNQLSGSKFALDNDEETFWNAEKTAILQYDFPKETLVNKVKILVDPSVGFYDYEITNQQGLSLKGREIPVGEYSIIQIPKPIPSKDLKIKLESSEKLKIRDVKIYER